MRITGIFSTLTATEGISRADWVRAEGRIELAMLGRQAKDKRFTRTTSLSVSLIRVVLGIAGGA